MNMAKTTHRFYLTKSVDGIDIPGRSHNMDKETAMRIQREKSSATVSINIHESTSVKPPAPHAKIYW